MSVRCSACGREYDVTLFQFGRTVDCDCGRRVALEARTAHPPAPRFAADAMLGRLARWLRLIGVDTSYEAHIDDRDLAARARLEGRIVLTRDTLVPRRFKDTPSLLIDSEAAAEQLAQVVRAFAIDWRAGAFSRCTRCNTMLEPRARRTAVGRVPVRVLRDQDRFAACPTCGRIYWRGSHVRRMRATLARTFGSEPEENVDDEEDEGREAGAGDCPQAPGAEP